MSRSLGLCCLAGRPAKPWEPRVPPSTSPELVRTQAAHTLDPLSPKVPLRSPEFTKGESWGEGGAEASGAQVDRWSEPGQRISPPSGPLLMPPTLKKEKVKRSGPVRGRKGTGPEVSPGGPRLAAPRRVRPWVPPPGTTPLPPTPTPTPATPVPGRPLTGQIGRLLGGPGAATARPPDPHCTKKLHHDPASHLAPPPPHRSAWRRLVPGAEGRTESRRGGGWEAATLPKRLRDPGRGGAVPEGGAGGGASGAVPEGGTGDRASGGPPRRWALQAERPQGRSCRALGRRTRASGGGARGPRDRGVAERRGLRARCSPEPVAAKISEPRPPLQPREGAASPCECVGCFCFSPV